MSQARYVEGRLAFSVRLPSYAIESVSNDVARLVEAVSRSGFEVKAMDVNIVTKGSDDFAEANQQYPQQRDECAS